MQTNPESILNPSNAARNRIFSSVQFYLYRAFNNWQRHKLTIPKMSKYIWSGYKFKNCRWIPNEQAKSNSVKTFCVNAVVLSTWTDLGVLWEMVLNLYPRRCSAELQNKRKQMLHYTVDVLWKIIFSKSNLFVNVSWEFFRKEYG